MGPAEVAKRIEDNRTLPSGNDERVYGYAVMGMPFESGEMLAMRRWVASSFGPPYDAVWHRNADGEWGIFVNAPLEVSCPRFFGSAASESRVGAIDIAWPGPETMVVDLDGGLIHWEVSLVSTFSTRMMNAMAAPMPDFLWRSAKLLGAMGRMAGPMLRAGKMGMAGLVPNGQRFLANPMRIWMVGDSKATVEGRDMGMPGAAGPQDHLADFWVPQKGIFAVGAFHAEALDPARHLVATSKAGAEVSGPLRA